VFADGAEDRLSPRPPGERHAALHDPPREMRVIGLGDELDPVSEWTDDHRFAAAGAAADW
jgi:hypothetical protein